VIDYYYEAALPPLSIEEKGELAENFPFKYLAVKPNEQSWATSVESTF
jgi:hypothetical protein